MSGGQPLHLSGGFTRQDERLVGWCWSSDRPGDRLRVSLLIDDTVFGIVVAAQLRPELRIDGVCDGYHGFEVPMPPASRPFSIIEAREQVSQRPIGRILAARMTDLRGWTVGAEAAQAKLRLLSARLGAGTSPHTNALARAVAASAPRQCGQDRPAFLPPGLRLPTVAAPRVSLLVDGVDHGTGILATIVAIAPLLGWARAELLVTDGGCGPVSASLQSLPGLSYCRTDAPGQSDRINQAACAARADTLIILRGHDGGPRALAALLDSAGGNPARAAPGPWPCDVVIGGAAAQAANALALTDGLVNLPDDAGCAGLELRVPRRAFADAGGLDPALQDGPGFSILDLALRLRGRGHPVGVWPGPSPRPPTSRPGTTAARQSLLQRWAPPGVRASGMQAAATSIP